MLIAAEVGEPLDVETDDQTVAVEVGDVVDPLGDGGGVVGDGGVNDVGEEEDVVGDGRELVVVLGRHLV